MEEAAVSHALSVVEILHREGEEAVGVVRQEVLQRSKNGRRVQLSHRFLIPHLQMCRQR